MTADQATTAQIRATFPALERRKTDVSGPFLQHICHLLYDSRIGTAIRESDNAFPIIESVHVLGITLLAGTIAVFDLRMLGLILRGTSITRVARSVLPLTWLGFVVMFVSGFLPFWSEAAKNYSNPAFRIKLVLLFLAGLNPLIFQIGIYRRALEWELATVAPWRARIGAVISLTLWSGIIVAGRAIAYF